MAGGRLDGLDGGGAGALLEVLEPACDELDRVWGWLDGSGPAEAPRARLLLARARLRAACAWLRALDELP
ncbi:MAG: hypothetical protein HZA24_11890 [Nitrospirae bacterium]|nr:hypothetical protein [Nitrospirota bacterium]